MGEGSFEQDWTPNGMDPESARHIGMIFVAPDDRDVELEEDFPPPPQGVPLLTPP